MARSASDIPKRAANWSGVSHDVILRRRGILLGGDQGLEIGLLRGGAAEDETHSAEAGSRRQRAHVFGEFSARRLGVGHDDALGGGDLSGDSGLGSLGGR